MNQPRPSGKRPRFRLTVPVLREPVLHRQIAEAFARELAAPGRISPQGVVWWSVDMAAYAGRVPGIRTGRGCIAGVPDIILLWEGRAYLIELKAEDGSLSPAQRDVAAATILSGCRYAVVRSLEEALLALDEWQIPRAHRIRRVT